MYVENDMGARICCRHPAEDYDIKKEIGISCKEIGLNIFSDFYSVKPKWWWSKKRRFILNLLREKTGYLSYCVCNDCLNKMVLDLGDEKSKWRSNYGYNRPKDERICSRCNSYKVRTLAESIGRLCPACKEGKITEIVTGLLS